ncbi:MAG TPA: GDP-L-fucose synthase [Glycomyces sp.]|nr:GDP-L-fucose synthase [Glycomyces sp.]
MPLDRRTPVFVAGHRGLVGSAVVRALEAAGFERILCVPRGQLDLRSQAAVTGYFERARPGVVVLAAARVGGIAANSAHPADFIRDNLLIQTNVIDAAFRAGVEKLVFLGSSCAYPRLAAQPIREDQLLAGPLEESNEPYAIAKIAGMVMVRAYRRQHGFRGISLMPTNLYGPGDRFDLEAGHVVPALMRRFHEARLRGEPEVVVWGSGTPRRELLHVDDLARAVVFLLERYDGEEPINVGTGRDISIAELAELIRDTVGYQGAIRFDPSRPDGTPRKLLDVSRLAAMGWRPRIALRDGLAATYRWYLEEGPGRDDRRS